MTIAPLLEICTDTLAGVLASENGGADRIEFCSRLDLDGLTPEVSALKNACAATSLPVVAMLRPNPNFQLDAELVHQMIVEITPLRNAGAQGFVLGGLNSNGEIPYSLIKDLVAATEGLPVTFHRAFDQVAQKEIALERLKEIGVSRLLTSGGVGPAVQNQASLQTLVSQSGYLQIIVGGGVRENQFPDLLTVGAAAFHSSLGYQPTAETVACLKTAITAENDSRA